MAASPFRPAGRPIYTAFGSGAGIVPSGVFNLAHYDFKEWWFES
jgi:hypothetical protein